MILKQLSAFTIIISSSLLAADCGDLKEGEVIRLDQKNHSLAKARVQDQDGLGSCYANTASVLLQSSIKDSPNLSYLNLALYYAEENNSRDQLNSFISIKNKDGKEERSNLFDGGHTCDTIALAKKFQSNTGLSALCKTEDVKLEHSFYNKEINAYDDGAQAQENIISNAAIYMSEYQRTFGEAKTPEEKLKLHIEAEKFNVALTNLIEENHKSFLTNECRKPKMHAIEMALSNMILDSLNRNKDCLENNKINDKNPNCQIYQQLGEVKVNNSTVDFFFHPQITEQLATKGPLIFSKDFTKNKSEKNFYDNIAATIAEKLDEKSQKNFKSFFNDLKKNIDPVDKNMINNEFERVIQGKVADCVKEDFFNFFWDEEGLKRLANQDQITCHYGNLIGSIPSLAMALIDSNLVNSTKDILGILTANTTRLGYRPSMMNLIAKDCQNDKKMAIPEKLNCADYDSPITQKTFRNPKELEEVTLGFRELMTSSLKNNRAFGVTVCTKFWSQPNYKWLMQEDEKSMYKNCEGKHGIHAFAVVGYRCKNNKIQYLGQNSWGPHWKLENNHFEIENGKIWLDEDELTANMSNINIMENDE